MTLQQLKYIVTVAECGNITEAAEKLFIAQPSLTSAIHNIEEEMGITAFIRSYKGRRNIAFICTSDFGADGRYDGAF